MAVITQNTWGQERFRGTLGIAINTDIAQHIDVYTSGNIFIVELKRILFGDLNNLQSVSLLPLEFQGLLLKKTW